MGAKRRVVIALILPLLAAACSSTGDDSPAPPDEKGKSRTVQLDERPFQLYVPRSYDAAAKAPLVVLLHGFTSNAAQQESYFKLTAESERRGFLYAMPDGTKNQRGEQFWNATPACCDFGNLGVDDSAYLSKLIESVKASHSVDAARVYLIGHSNGGFMSYRMACDHADQVTAIVSLAGAATSDAAACKPSRPVSILQIHGTADRTIQFGGGANIGRPYPSVAGTLALWRGLNGCADKADTAAKPLDLDAGLPGPETTVTTYTEGCRDAARVELWSIKDGGHIPALSAGYAPAVIDFLYSQS